MDFSLSLTCVVMQVDFRHKPQKYPITNIRVTALILNTFTWCKFTLIFSCSSHYSLLTRGKRKKNSFWSRLRDNARQCDYLKRFGPSPGATIVWSVSPHAQNLSLETFTIDFFADPHTHIESHTHTFSLTNPPNQTVFFWYIQNFFHFFFISLLLIYHQQHQSWVKVNQEVLTLLEN